MALEDQRSNNLSFQAIFFFLIQEQCVPGHCNKLTNKSLVNMDRESRTLKFAGLNASALDWKKQRHRKREQTKTFALIHFSRHPLSSLFFHFFFFAVLRSEFSEFVESVVKVLPSFWKPI